MVCFACARVCQWFVVVTVVIRLVVNFMILKTTVGFDEKFSLPATISNFRWITPELLMKCIHFHQDFKHTQVRFHSKWTHLKKGMPIIEFSNSSKLSVYILVYSNEKPLNYEFVGNYGQIFHQVSLQLKRCFESVELIFHYNSEIVDLNACFCFKDQPILIDCYHTVTLWKILCSWTFQLFHHEFCIVEHWLTDVSSFLWFFFLLK